MKNWPPQLDEIIEQITSSNYSQMIQPTPFKKTQRDIALNELVSRQYAIPADVYKFARMAQFDFVGKPGRGRSNVPTLCDIYQTLAIEGLHIVRKMSPNEQQPVFVEIGQPADCTMARIKFDAKFDTELRLLKSEADAGQFIITPSASDARQVKKISLISLAVNLMRLAIAEREKPAVMPQPQINAKRKTGARS